MSKQANRRIAHKMTRFGLLLWATGCVRLHKDGDGFKEIYRLWHPVTWLMAPVVLVLCGVMGEKFSTVFPIRVSPFWERHRDQLQWVTPFTRLSDLRPFVHTPNNAGAH